MERKGRKKLLDTSRWTAYNKGIKKGRVPVDGYALKLLLKNDRTFGHGAVIVHVK